MTAVIITVLLGVIGNIIASCLIERRQQILSKCAHIARLASTCLVDLANSLDRRDLNKIKKIEVSAPNLKEKNRQITKGCTRSTLRAGFNVVLFVRAR